MDFYEKKYFSIVYLCIPYPSTKKYLVEVCHRESVSVRAGQSKLKLTSKLLTVVVIIEFFTFHLSLR